MCECKISNLKISRRFPLIFFLNWTSYFFFKLFFFLQLELSSIKKYDVNYDIFSPNSLMLQLTTNSARLAMLVNKFLSSIGPLLIISVPINMPKSPQILFPFFEQEKKKTLFHFLLFTEFTMNSWVKNMSKLSKKGRCVHIWSHWVIFLIDNEKPVERCRLN